WRVSRVDDERLAIELGAEDVGQSRVPPLFRAAGVVHFERLRGIEVQIEVIRLQDAPVELLVLDFVAAEVLRVGRLNAAQSGEDEGESSLLANSCHLSPESTPTRDGMTGRAAPP